MVHTSGPGSLIPLVLALMGEHGGSAGDWTAREWAAHIAILVLRAGARDPGARSEEPVAINGNAASNDAEAVRVIADLPKPLACTAAVSGRALSITCTTITEPILLEAQRDKARVIARLRSTYGAAAPEPTLLLDAQGERALVPLSAIEVFLADYRLNYALAFDDPDDEAQQRGAAGIVQVRSVGNVEMTGRSPDVKWVFGKRRHPEL